MTSQKRSSAQNPPIEQQLVDLANEEGTDPLVKEILLHMAAQKMIEDVTTP